MKKILWIVGCLLGLTGPTSAASLASTPGADFGTITFVTNNSGTPSVTVTPTRYAATASSASTGGNLGGYSPTNVTLTPIQFSGMSHNKKMFVTLNNTSNYTISTPGCGTLSVTNVSLHTHNTTASYRYKITDATTLYNAENGAFLKMTVALTDFDATESCTISGGIPFGWQESNNTPTTWNSATYAVSMAIISPITFTHDTGAKLDFGQLCFSTNAQTLVVSPAGIPTGTGLACTVGSVTADSFTVAATNAINFSVTLPTSAITLSNSNGPGTLTVDNFTSSCSSSCPVAANGSTSFTVGGTLHVPARPTAGEYTGVYPVSLVY